jgi:hypothetical protein
MLPIEETDMKALLVIPTLAALALAGCASQGDTRVAQADCKVYPITTDSSTGNKPQVDSIRQRAAEADLGTSSLRFRGLARNGGPGGNNIEEVLRDCNR